jgi:ABC-type glutathione transport system ATPase component
MSKQIFSANNVNVTFKIGRGKNKSEVRALNNVCLDVNQGEIVGLVGESGSGKSTMARVIVGLQKHDSGKLMYLDTPIPQTRTLEDRRKIQMIFQDPYSSLDPRMSVKQSILELLDTHDILPKEKRLARCKELLSLVKLPESLLDSRPYAMSGGQRQRVAIARALSLNPNFLIADEAVSALDVSVQASIINLLADLRESLNLSILFISHDLAIVRLLCDRVNVINSGVIVESSPTMSLFDNPAHEYTRQLIAAVPKLDAIVRNTN